LNMNVAMCDYASYTSGSGAYLMPVVKPTKDPRGSKGFRLYAESVRRYELSGEGGVAVLAVEDDEEEDDEEEDDASTDLFQEWCDELRTATHDPLAVDDDDECVGDSDSEETDYYRDEYGVDSDYESDEDVDEAAEVPVVRKVARMSREAWLVPMDQECPLCLDGLTRAECVTTSCQHAFCKTCYARYRKRACPCCRQWVETLTCYDMVDSASGVELE